MTAKVSLFQSLRTTSAWGSEDYYHVFDRIQGKSKHIDKVMLYRDNHDKNVKFNEIPTVTWSGTFSRRKNSGVVRFSDLLYCDFDKVDPIETKQALARIKYVHAAWTSVSGDGVGALVLSKELDKTNFKPTINTLHKYLEERDLHTDKLSDIARCNVLSYDKDIYVNDSPEIFKPVTNTKVSYDHVLLGSKLTEDVETACTISIAYTYKKGLRFIPGQRHNFTVTYFSMTNHFGVDLHTAYMFAMDNNCISPVTYKKAEKIYKDYANQHGIKNIYED